MWFCSCHKSNSTCPSLWLIEFPAVNFTSKVKTALFTAHITGFLFLIHCFIVLKLEAEEILNWRKSWRRISVDAILKVTELTNREHGANVFRSLALVMGNCQWHHRLFVPNNFSSSQKHHWGLWQWRESARVLPIILHIVRPRHSSELLSSV